MRPDFFKTNSRIIDKTSSSWQPSREAYTTDTLRADVRIALDQIKQQKMPHTSTVKTALGHTRLGPDAMIRVIVAIASTESPSKCADMLNTSWSSVSHYLKGRKIDYKTVVKMIEHCSGLHTPLVAPIYPNGSGTLDNHFLTDATPYELQFELFPDLSEDETDAESKFDNFLDDLANDISGKELAHSRAHSNMSGDTMDTNNDDLPDEEEMQRWTSYYGAPLNT